MFFDGRFFPTGFAWRLDVFTTEGFGSLAILPLITRSLHDDAIEVVPVRDNRDDSEIDANAQVICAQVTYTWDFIYLKKRSLYEDVVITF
jgi:hypothetical protein